MSNLPLSSKTDDTCEDDTSCIHGNLLSLTLSGRKIKLIFTYNLFYLLNLILNLLGNLAAVELRPTKSYILQLPGSWEKNLIYGAPMNHEESTLEYNTIQPQSPPSFYN